jgi:hypothetical protein
MYSRNNSTGVKVLAAGRNELKRDLLTPASFMEWLFFSKLLAPFMDKRGLKSNFVEHISEILRYWEILLPSDFSKSLAISFLINIFI